jgi:histidine triad (HIT) family protein
VDTWLLHVGNNIDNTDERSRGRSRADRVERSTPGICRALSCGGVSDCVFCSINGTPGTAHEVLRDSIAVAFLDRAPVFPGHVLIVPTRHVQTLGDLPAELVGPFFERVQRISDALPHALGCEGTWVSMNNIVSQSVPHLHVHVVPRTRKDGLRGFYWPRQKYPHDGAMADAAAAISAALRSSHPPDP